MQKIFYIILFYLLTIQSFCFSILPSKQINNDSILIISEVKISGNNVTKEKIILRELPFRIGDTLPFNLLNDYLINSKQNLLNTSLFNFVTITSSISKNLLLLTIDVEERWYFWPYPIFEHADRNLSSFIENRDINRINYGAYFIKYNFRGRKEILKIKTRLGYREQYSLFYQNPFIDQKQRNGIGFDFNFFRQKEIAYKTENNQLKYFRSPENNYLLHTINAELNYIYRKYLFNTHTLYLGYSFNKTIDSILKLNPNYFLYNKTTLSYPFFYYTFSRDCRDSKVYPLKGYYFDFNISREGIPVVENSDMNILYFKGNIKGYFALHQKIYLGTEVKAKYTFDGYNSYFTNKALGYADFLRGFEYYVIDGSDYVASKTNFKFEIIKPRVKQFSRIPLPKFNKVHYAMYSNLFFDCGYVNDIMIPLSNSMVRKPLFSGGIGFDFVTYYDKIFRVECSINNFGNYGIFIHYGAPIFVTE